MDDTFMKDVQEATNVPEYSLTVLDLDTYDVYAYACWEPEGDVLEWMAGKVRITQAHAGHSTLKAHLLRK